MIRKESTLYSIVHQTCPQCHEGKMFASGVFSPNFMKMNSTCSNCGLDFIREPAYYFGAMYFSYAIQVTLFVAVYLVLRYTTNPDISTYIFWTIASVLIALPWNYRVSRVMWISLFIRYRGVRS